MKINFKQVGLLVALSLLVIFAAACGGSDATNGNAGTLNVQGSDTMVNLSQAWAERYMNEENEEADIIVTGGGSGTGIAALLNDDTHIAIASRAIRDSELETAADNAIDIHEFVVGQDGVAIYVHPDNPIQQFTVAELKDIFTGVVTDWADVGWAEGGTIDIYSRQDNSGTYAFVVEVIMDDEDWAAGTNYMPGSSALVEGVSQNSAGIGYSGVGYATEDTVIVAVARDESSEYLSPLEEENVLSGNYAVARPLFFYTNGEPAGVTLDFLNYVLKASEAQEVLDDQGFYGIGAYQEANQAIYSNLGIDW